MQKAISHFITAVISAAIGSAAAGLSVYGDVQGIKSSVARIELRLDALASTRVASK